VPLLAAIFSSIGIYGAQLVGVQIMGVDAGSFWSQMRAVVSRFRATECVRKRMVTGVKVQRPLEREVGQRHALRATPL